jgi:NodT family efflux transporter outer membrane factor (OMF) lipoprotein
MECYHYHSRSKDRSMASRRTRKIQFAAVLAALSMTGCAVGPKYAAPDPGVPPNFRNAAALGADREQDAVDLASWWRGFGDPVLDKVIDQALSENLDLAQAVARVQQARASAGVARAALLPSGELSSSAAAAHQSVQTPDGRIEQALGVDRNGDLYAADVGASWDVDLFGGLRRGHEASVADYQAADAAAAAARVSIAAEAADAYILVRTLQARLAVARAQADAQAQTVKLVRLKFSRGVAAEAQAREAESALSAAQSQIPALEAALETATNGLEVLMGVRPGAWRTALAAPSPIPTPPAISTADGPASLLRRRPDIIVAERRLAAANARIGEAVAEYYPHFSLSALMGFSTTSAASLASPGAAETQAIAGVRWRLFDFGRVGSEVAAAKGRHAEALTAYRLTVLQATEDVENAFAALAKGREQALLLASAEQSLERAYQASLAAHANGAASVIDNLDVDQRLLSAQEARIIAQSETARAAVASFRALGGGWQA